MFFNSNNFNRRIQEHEDQIRDIFRKINGESDEWGLWQHILGVDSQTGIWNTIHNLEAQLKDQSIKISQMEQQLQEQQLKIDTLMGRIPSLEELELRSILINVINDQLGKNINE
ncbi:MAG: hypothetical protein RR506_09665 [Akkermansia sp.]